MAVAVACSPGTWEEKEGQLKTQGHASSRPAWAIPQRQTKPKQIHPCCDVTCTFDNILAPASLLTLI